MVLRSRYVWVIAALLVVGLIAWAFRPKVRLIPGSRWFAGVKYSSSGPVLPGPELKILSPTTTTVLKRGSLIEFVVQVRVSTGGEFPSLMLLTIDLNGQQYASSFPENEPQADGSVLCRMEFLVPNKPGRYRFVAQAQDLIKPNSFASGRTIKTYTTSEAAVDLTVN